MSLKKIISESLAQNPVGIKEAFTQAISEKISLALESKLDQLDELSKSTLGSYIKKASDVVARNAAERQDITTGPRSERLKLGDRIDQNRWLNKNDAKRKTGMNRAIGSLTKEDLDESTEIKGDHLISAKLIHKDLKIIDTLSPDTQKVLKRHEKQMITKYGEDWRKKAGITESVNQLDEVISKAERRNLAYHEKQAVRAAEKANVGALPRSDKEKWIDDYIAKNFIPKGAVGSAVYSGVMKVRPIKVEK